MKIQSLLTACVLLVLTACASHTGVVPLGKDTFMIAKQAATGFPGLGNMKAEIIGEGTNYCRSQNKKFQIVSFNETQPPYIFGNFPRSEISFTCVSVSDVALTTEPKKTTGENENLSQVNVFKTSIVNNSTTKRIAFVIGNSNYKKYPLKNPKNDADDISQTLRESGFDVIDIRDANLSQMRNALRNYGDKLISYDVGLVYYSGHGIEVKGRNYFLPVNADIQREDEIADQGLDVNLILEKMNTASKSVNILIVDACRDNPFARGFRGINKGLAQIDAPTGTIVAFATAPGKTASDGDGRNSPFTKNLILAIKKSNISIESVFKEVRKKVIEETNGQQTPWESSSLIGDFYFRTIN